MGSNHPITRGRHYFSKSLSSIFMLEREKKKWNKRGRKRKGRESGRYWCHLQWFSHHLSRKTSVHCLKSWGETGVMGPFACRMCSVTPVTDICIFSLLQQPGVQGCLQIPSVRWLTFGSSWQQLRSACVQGLITKEGPLSFLFFTFLLFISFHVLEK